MRRRAREDGWVESLVRGFARSPRQLNRVHESDAELIRLPGGEAVLAITVDQIVEEVRAGLYDDPYLLGWMTVVASASDLAAVGAEPLGVVIGQVFPVDPAPGFVEALQRGLAEASEAADLPILGGDTAFAGETTTSATAVGLVPDGKPLTRRGATAGHRLFATGPLGLGSVFAWAKLQGHSAPEFRPRPRLAAGILARGCAAAAADTSDGALAACDLLLPPEGLGLDLYASPAEYLHPAALRLAGELGVPEWTLLAGPHGEFELLLAVPEEAVPTFRRGMGGLGLRPVELGAFRPGEASVRVSRARVAVDPARVRDLHREAPADPRAFLSALTESAQPLARNGEEARRAIR
jgi:thiamine-monophosphate kinase